jgi:hypothetical protein
VKPHPRIRKTIKWGGAAVTVLLVVVWIGSGWFIIDWEGSNKGVSLRGGRIAIHGADFERDVRPLPGLQIYRPRGTTFSLQLTQFYWVDNIYGWLLIVPQWVLTAPVLFGTATAWRLDTLARRRARLTPHLCPKCSYDRTGLAKDAVCPECGSKGGPA